MVPVAVRSLVVRPPYRERVLVAKDPLFVTSARVSVSTYTGQLVPFARQTLVPPTVREVVTSRVVPVAPVNVMRLISAVPVTERSVTPRRVPVPYPKVRSWRDVVPVAVRSAVVRPPKKVTALVVTAPKVVTSCRVWLSAAQFVPFERQTGTPATVSGPVISRLVPVAPPKSRFVAKRFVGVLCRYWNGDGI